MNDYFTILKNCREVSSQHEA